MRNLLMKIILLPLIVALCSAVFDNVDLVAWYQPIGIGVLLAIIGHLMEKAILRRNTTVMTDIADFITAALVVYFLSLFYDGARVTFGGAILTALVITLVEIAMHRWLVRSGRTEKSTA
ncbi:DUF2512 family protein [Bacillus sinesaloumensis]|uniref:DUF2512 family protein n=1 Tax=Litchfieldia sinesaloumensis TaxID=1926280 RepID=UPI00098865FF|nr:DUF2512 family protein [Bacillus sinesaloumensis]